MILNGWPSDKSIFDHAAYELLKWASEHKDEFRGIVGKSMERRNDLIFKSRDNIPELNDFKRNPDNERHIIEMETNQFRNFGGTQKIQLKSRR
jgi:hypothetical protein